MRVGYWNKLGGLLAVSAVLLGAAAVQAEEPGHERGARAEARGPARDVRAGGERFAFHDHDVRRFSAADRGRWIGGRWNNTCFAGRCGWWWFAGGQWYFYDTPVYPYPLVVSPIGYAEPVAPAPMMVAPAPVMMAPAPVAVMPQPMPMPAPPPAAPVPAPPKFLYYCDNPAGYYPAVANCNTAFRQVAVPPSQ